jgi:hypothetical protein
MYARDNLVQGWCQLGSLTKQAYPVTKLEALFFASNVEAGSNVVLSFTKEETGNFGIY